MTNYNDKDMQMSDHETACNRNKDFLSIAFPFLNLAISKEGMEYGREENKREGAKKVEREKERKKQKYQKKNFLRKNIHEVQTNQMMQSSFFFSASLFYLPFLYIPSFSPSLPLFVPSSVISFQT